MSKPILIIKTGSSLPELIKAKGDFEDWIVAGMDKSTPVLVINVTQDTNLPQADQITGVVITGSHSMVTEHTPWIEKTAEWLAQAVEQNIPVLGICFGHQLLAYALGGEVGDNPRGNEYGTATVNMLPLAKNDPLFSRMAENFTAQVCHTQTVLKMPPGAILLARSAKDDCQAFSYGKQTWGVQFHPEFDAEVMRTYINYSRQRLIDEGQDPERLLEGVRETPNSAALLGEFARIIRST